MQARPTYANLVLVFVVTLVLALILLYLQYLPRLHLQWLALQEERMKAADKSAVKVEQLAEKMDAALSRMNGELDNLKSFRDSLGATDLPVGCWFC